MLVVLDTNVLVAALRSVHGASNEVLRLLALNRFCAAVSTALCLEYEDVLRRPGMVGAYTPSELETFLNSICSLAKEAFIYFRWRPFLKDPKDDMILELAMASGATHIITHNVKDFAGTQVMGISAVTPAEFLCILRHS